MKIKKSLGLGSIAVVSAFMLASCGEAPSSSIDPINSTSNAEPSVTTGGNNQSSSSVMSSLTDEQQREIYKLALNAGYTGTYEEWLASIKGEKGDKGDKGDKGETGATGATGPAGTQGEKGETGATGPAGTQGEKGDTGATGPTGATGNGILKVEKSGSENNVDTYTITFTDGTTFSFTVTNGKDAETPKNEGTFGLDYYPLDDGTLGVKAGKANQLSTIVIPAEYNGLSVTKILDNGFSSCDNLTTITIPNGITSIGYSAFSGCSKLTSVSLPQNVTLGYAVFDGCSNLKYNEYDNGLYLGNNENPYLVLMKAKSITITSCEIKEGCKVISDYVFKNCSNLTTVTLPNSIEKIESTSFDGCTSLTGTESNNALYIGNEVNPYLILLKAKDTTITSCEINENCKYMYGNAFTGCSAITSVNLPNDIIVFNALKFTNCSNLTSISIPKGVTSIVESAFEGCSKLETVSMPEKVSYIDSRAFYNCYSLSTINLPDNLNTIGEHAFYNCNKLKNITLPDSIYSISDYTFYNCYSLSTIKLPDNLNTIGEYAFYNCYSLISLTFPANVIRIGTRAFASCYNLTSVTLLGLLNLQAIGYAPNEFQGCYKLLEIYNLTGDQISNSYYSGSGYITTNAKVIHTSKDEESIYTIKDGYQFAYFDNKYYLVSYVGTETNLVLPDSINGQNYEIYQYLFYYNQSITSVLLSDANITGAGYSTVNGCEKLTYNEYDNGLYIGTSTNPYLVLAKAKDTTITSIEINSNCKIIQSLAFKDCTELTNVTIPEGVTNIYYSAFYGCSKLESVSLPSSLTTISNQIFRGCSSLTSVTIPNSVTIIGINAFRGCSNLTSITIPNSVTSIGASAFQDCSNLTSVTIPSSVTSIGSYAFYNCSKLTSITFTGTKAEWNQLVTSNIGISSYTVHCTDGDITN